MTVQTITIRSEGMTLAKLIWQVLRRQPAGYLEVVLDANPGLAARGDVLPVGTVVRLPLERAEPKTSTANLVRLWD